MSAKEKVTIYLPPELLDDIKGLAEDTERSMSWLIEKAWIMAQAKLETMTIRPAWKEKV